ncbi:hypothetical protein MDV076.4 [Gallid alphaherpesvirus 2]|uniref:Uncharacterized protein n=1 Tax=Gallid alphaherpesvirus 2 TaxID=10390 RepID=Q15AF3_9ALPH|nr:hypothetical protein MDV076.4 [Gallid alphaherpesvirus 2]AEZ51626.1 hypothetical protein MDV005.3 [Gallid alphaherpesvirus 2]AEZ51746.1 hypothetical protein MDV076.4 [Gallid alphaherpesvirus 2]AFX97835.1 hypothetical protein MDV005.3 [Gallid alphaherpesvirus 2]AFX97882.1 hypothetical protein MDV076.4 [Gallid alphaherpesvirus 2]
MLHGVCLHSTSAPCVFSERRHDSFFSSFPASVSPPQIGRQGRGVWRGCWGCRDFSFFSVSKSTREKDRGGTDRQRDCRA